MGERDDDEDPRAWGAATRAVRGGLARSNFGEVAEALYLTQSYVYDTAQSADARFAGTDPGFIYTRYGNPTIQMFEDRLALIEGAEYCRALASGMSAVHVALTGLVKAGDHIVAGRALFGSCRWDPQQLGPPVRRRDHPGRRARTSTPGGRPCGRTQRLLFARNAGQSAAGDHRHRRRVRRSPSEVGARVIVDNVFATPIFSGTRWTLGRRHRRSIRPPSTSTARAGCWAARSWAQHALLEEAYKRHRPPYGSRPSRRSTPGCCSRASRPSTCGCRRQSRHRGHAGRPDRRPSPRSAACRYPGRRPTIRSTRSRRRQMRGGGNTVGGGKPDRLRPRLAGGARSAFLNAPRDSWTSPTTWPTPSRSPPTPARPPTAPCRWTNSARSA